MNESLLDSTLSKLGESIARQAASSINSLLLPEFKGLPSEDVEEFIFKFKMATLTLSDDLKCMALNKALTGSAYIWAKNNIKDKMANGQWEEIKRELINRFGPHDREVSYRKRLNEMKFEENRTTLMSYVEAFIDSYKKAYASANDKDITKALRINLPDKIIKGLNYLDHKWTDYESLSDVTTLIKRFEEKIMPFDHKEGTDTKSLTAEQLLSALKEFKEAIRTEVKKELSTAEKPHALNTISHDHNPPSNGFPNGSNRNNNRYIRNDKRKYQSLQDQYQDQSRNYDKRTKVEYAKTKALEESKKAKIMYEQRFGKLPGSCWTCEGDHFNRHCPFINVNNLN